MAIPNFSGDEDKDEINPIEWLRMIKKINLKPLWKVFIFMVKLLSGGIALMKILDYLTWEKIEELFSNIWIRDTKMEAMYKIEYELKETKKEIKKKGGELSKIRDLNETLIKEVQKLK
jgi:hypothetical protein